MPTGCPLTTDVPPAEEPNNENPPQTAPPVEEESSSLGRELVPFELTAIAEALREQETSGVLQGMMLASSQRSGPLPSAEEFRQYGEVLESAPDRILAMAEKSLEHRMAQQDRSSRTDALLGVLGLIFAFLLALVVLGGSIWLIGDGKEVAGTILATLDLVALVTVFIFGRRSHGSAD